MVLFLIVLVVMGVGGVRLALDDDEFEGDFGQVEEFTHEDLRAVVITRMQELPKPTHLIVKSGLGDGESLVFSVS